LAGGNKRSKDVAVTLHTTNRYEPVKSNKHQKDEPRVNENRVWRAPLSIMINHKEGRHDQKR
jgi:hypothetical protein